MTLICQTLKIVFKHEAKLLHYEIYVREPSHILRSTTALLTNQACQRFVIVVFPDHTHLLFL